MIKILLISFVLLSPLVNQAQNNETKILLGDMQIDKVILALQGKKVAVMANHTAMVGNVHLVDTMKSLHVNIQKIFAPEHGFRGLADAGEEIKDAVDVKSGIPVVSLYGKHFKPTTEELADVDIVVFDVQDVGVRFFTYISSLHYLMEACALHHKKLLILDRPNPNGSFIDGPVLKDKSLRSFIGMHQIPIAHGLTIGELAQMINGEGWLEGGLTCELEIVVMKNYTHRSVFSLPLRPSPNLPNDHAITMYPSTCLFEGTAMSVGRGTTNPFEWIGHPDLKNYGFHFTPVSIPGMAKNPPYENKVCYGLDLRNENPPHRISIQYVIDLYKAFDNKEKFFTPYFDKLAGTRELKDQIRNGLSEEAIRSSWKQDLEVYKIKRSKYLLYP